MDPHLQEKLRYRRQYIITPREIDCPFLHHKTKLSDSFFLYSHKELTMNTLEQQGQTLILLGELFDAESPWKGNIEILKDIKHKDFDIILKRLAKYSGNFVLLSHTKDQTRIVHDATANKKIYYCQKEGRRWCASQPHLLARVCGFSYSQDPSRLAYYDSSVFRNLDHASAGNTTCYDEISQLLPNFYLDLNTLRISRYWPLKIRQVLSIEECADRCSYLIKGFMDSIISRFDIMLPVTAGKDSRALLSATREHKDKVFYYINQIGSLDQHSNDILLPKKILQELDLDFHILDTDTQVDEDFKKIYFENNPMASPAILPIIYNYFKNFGDKVNLPGNVATGATWFYPTLKKKHNPELLLRIANLSHYSHAEAAYSWWHEQASPYSKESGFSIFDLFYWEERMGNWGTQYMQDKEMAQTEFNVFNSQLLVETILSVEPMYAIRYGSYFLNSAIIRRLWPESLSAPINPGKTKDRVLFLEKYGLINMVYKLWSKGFLNPHCCK